MSTHTTFTHRLQPLQIFKLAEGAPALLTVTDGTLWLTRGDCDDIILAVGDCASIEPGHTSVASPLRGAGSFELVAAAASTLARAA